MVCVGCGDLSSVLGRLPHRFLISFFVIFLLSALTFADCPGSINSDYTMASDESSTSSCVIFGADNLTLDCQGHSITLTGGANYPAVDSGSSAKNITIKNCVIVDNSATNRNMGVVRFQQWANHSTLVDTNITSNGHIGLYTASSYMNFTNVRVTTGSGNAYRAVEFQSSSHNILKDFYANKTGNDYTYSIYWHSGTNNTLDNVTAYSNVGTTRMYGTYLYGFTDSRIVNSYLHGGYNYAAIQVVGGSSNNLFENITVKGGSNTASHGIYIDTSVGNNFSYIDINTTGSCFYLASSSGNTRLVHSNLTSTGSSGLYLYAASASNNNIFHNLSVVSTNTALYIRNSGYNNFTSSVFNSSTSYPMYAYSGTDGNIFANSIFHATSTSNYRYGLYFATSSSNNYILNNTILPATSYRSYAIYYQGANSNYNEIDNNNITALGNQGRGIYFEDNPSDYNNITNNNITSNYTSFQAVGGNNIISNNMLNSTNYMGIVLSSSNGNTVSNNTINALNYGVYLYTNSYNNVYDNTVKCSTYALYIYLSSYNNLSNNYFEADGDGRVAYIVTSSSYNRLVNNTFNHSGSAGASNRYTLQVSQSSNNLFDRNIISSSSHYPLSVETSANYNNFTNNSVFTNYTNTYALRVQTASEHNNFIDNNFTSERGYGFYILTNVRYNKFSGGFVDAYTQRGIVLGGSSMYNNFSNMNVRTGIGSGGNIGIYAYGSSSYNRFDGVNVTVNASQGVYLTSSSGNVFTNSTITSRASYAVYLYDQANENSFDNVRIHSNSSNAVYMRRNINRNSFSNFNISNDANTYAVYLNGDGNIAEYNNFTNGTINNSASSGYALALYNNANHNWFTNVTVTNSLYRGMYMYIASNNNFDSSSIAAANVNNAYAVLMQTLSTGNNFTNTTLYAPAASGGYELYIGNSVTQPSSASLLNCNFDEFGIAFGDSVSHVNVSWYVNVNVTDLSGTVPIEGALVTIRDAFGNVITNTTTDENGVIPYVVALQHMRKSGGSTSYTPHNTSVIVGIASKNQSNSISATQTINVLMNASTCGLLSSDTSLKNNVFGSDTCFTASASGITLDCQGYTINYSRHSAGCGLSASSYISGLNIVNCTFSQGDYSSSSSGAVCLSTSSSAIVTNSSINAKGSSNGYDFYVDGSSYASVINVTTNQSNSYIDSGSNITRSWYLDINLTDSSSNPLPYGQILVNDTYGSVITVSNVTNGVAQRLAIAQYLATGASNFTYYNNYTILGWTGNSSNTTSVNVSSNMAVSLPIPADTCGPVSSDITLQNNLYSNGTCLVAQVSGITIDCNGYTINYSRSGDGYYGLDTNAYDNINLVNCNLAMGNSSATNSYGIFVNNSAGFTITNSTITGNSALFNYSSINARFLNVTFDNSTINFSDSTSNASVAWYANVHTVGLASEDVNASNVTVYDNSSNVIGTGTTNSNGNYIMQITQYSQKQSGITEYGPFNFSALHPETLTTNYTLTNITQSQNVTIGLISAAIDFVTPTENQIFFQGASVSIQINETRGSSWINNVTVNVTGDGQNLSYQASESPSDYWTYSYSIDPSQVATTLTITAYGRHGDASVSETRNFIVTRASSSGIDMPIITYSCPDTTYMAVNDTTNISVRADLDTVLYSLNINVTMPDGNSTSLSNISFAEDTSNYTYNKTWEYSPNQSGTHTIFVEARDVNDNRVNTTFYIYVVPSNSSIGFSTSGFDSSELRDVCSENVIASTSSSFSGTQLPAGLYNLMGIDNNRAEISLNSFNVTQTNATVFNYSTVSTSSVDAPSNRRNVYLFSAYGASSTYSSASALINYTSDEGTLVAENSLEMKQCESTSNCNWTSINSTLNTTSNIINTTLSNLSGIFGLFEPAYNEPQYVTADPPTIVTFTSDYLNVEQNQNVTVYLDFTLNASLGAVTVNVTYPGGSNATLSNISYSSGSGNTHNYTYLFNANETGIYAIDSKVRDQYSQNTTSSFSVIVSALTQSVDILGYGLDGLTIRDPANDAIILTASISNNTANASGTLIPGNYTAEAQGDYAAITIQDVQINNSFDLLNYTNLSLTSTSAPANRTAIYLFSLQNLTNNYSSSSITVDYSSLLASISSEAALEIHACASSGCSNMTQVSATINDALHTITFTPPNLSAVYGLYVNSLVIENTNTITNTEYQSSTQIKKVEKEVPVEVPVEVEKKVPVEVEKLTTLRILPGPLHTDLKPGQESESQITLTNNAGKDLGNVVLSLQSEGGDIHYEISPKSISLKKGSTSTANLKIKSTLVSGNYEAKLFANVPSLNLKDEMPITVSVGKNLENDKKRALERIKFASNLLNENSECLDLSEGILTANALVDNGFYVDADNKAQTVITGCSSMMALRGKPILKTEVFSQMNWSYAIIAAVVLTSIFGALGMIGLMFIVSHSRKSHKKNLRKGKSSHPRRKKGNTLMNWFYELTEGKSPDVHNEEKYGPKE